MRLFIALTLFFAAAASSSASSTLRANAADVAATSPEMRALIKSKAAKAKQLSSFLQSLKEQSGTRDLQNDSPVPELYEGDESGGNDGVFGGFDFGDDFDLGSFGLCGGEDNDLEVLGARCWCTLRSGENEYDGLMDLIGDFSYIMDNGMEVEFGCEMPTVCDTAIGVNECSAGQVTCTLDIDTQDFMSSSFDCDTCVKYDNSPDENGKPNGDPTDMTGKVLCMDVDMCPPPVVTERSGLADFDIVSNLLCGCTATLDGEDCTCELCDDFWGGVKLQCDTASGDKIASTCEETGLEFVDASDISTLTEVKFAPQFAIVQSDASESESSPGVAAAPGAAYAAFVATLCLGALLISFI